MRNPRIWYNFVIPLSMGEIAMIYLHEILVGNQLLKTNPLIDLRRSPQKHIQCDRRWEMTKKNENGKRKR